MKRLFGNWRAMVLLAGLTCCSAIITLTPTGCAPSQQATAFNTLFTVEKSTVTAYDSYIGLVIAGQLPTNDVPKVSKAFNTFQASFLIALNLAQLNSNAPAPASLVIESANVKNQISALKGHQ